MNILITGLPKSGKTTLLRTIMGDFLRKTGFLTNEVRENDIRTGFEIETSKGEKKLFASTGFNTQNKIGKYFVDISVLDEALPSISTFQHDDILFIDEIGPMELISESFKHLYIKYLDAPNLCIATSQLYVNNFTEEIKKRTDTLVFEITSENRDIKMQEILKIIHSF